MAGCGSLVHWRMTSVDGVKEFVVGTSFGLQTMVGVCSGVFVRVREASLTEGFVCLGLHCKRGFSTVAFIGLGVGLGLGIEFLGTHL